MMTNLDLSEGEAKQKQKYIKQNFRVLFAYFFPVALKMLIKREHETINVKQRGTPLK